MKLDKVYRISIFVIACILINYVGKYVAESYELPLWLDSIGTIISAYGLGPVCGAIVGFTGNIIYGLMNETGYIYSITSIFIGIIVGIMSKRKFMESKTGTAFIATVLAFISVIISTPLNIILYKGSTGNKWGDGVIGFISEHNVNKYFIYVIGEFYVDFLDKMVSMFILYVFIKIVRFIRDNTIKDKDLSIIIIFIISAAYMVNMNNYKILANDASSDSENYNAYIQKTYNGNNGLNCGEANDIEQTNDGILWIGTYAGLYRYNGSEFRWIKEFDSVKNVNCLYTDEEGRLWIGTNDSGLSLLINNKIVNIVDETNGLPSYSVRSVVQCADGNYYIGTANSLAIVSLKGGLSVLDTIDGVQYASDLSADNTGKVASITADGTLFILKNGKIDNTIVSNIDGEIFTCCKYYDDGVLYVGTNTNRVYVYNVDDKSCEKEKEFICDGLNSINEISFMENDDVIVCSDTGVGYINKNGKFESINTGNFNNSIDHMEVDYQGNIWFTSSRMGLMCMCESIFTDVYNESGVENVVTNAATILNNYMYVGTDKGLDIIDLKNNKEINNNITEEMDGYRIRCVCKDDKENIWISSYGKGLVKYESNGTIKCFDTSNGLFGNRCRVVRALSNGQIIAGGDLGVSIIKDDQVIKTFESGDEISNSLVLCILEGNNGEIFIGTDGSGIDILEKNGDISHISRKDGLGSGVILRIVSDRSGEGYFIVSSNSISYMDRDRKIRELKNFPYFNNYDVCESDDGTLFVTGSAGIYVLDKEKLLSGNEEIEYDLLNAESGLDSSLVANSWNCYDENENLYLACDSGIFMINMHKYSLGSISYRMLISEIKIDNVSYKIERGTELKINRGAKKIEIFPEIINYGIGEPYIRYYLEGFDNEPIVAQRSQLSSIVYTNIPKGKYKFIIEVIDVKQNTVLEKSTYTLVKEKEIYDDSGFKLYMILVGALAVIVFTWLITKAQVNRTLKIQRKELELAKKQVKMADETILAIARTVDAKDENTSQHSMRVSDYSVMIAREYGMNEEECENLRRAAMLHDIGKIGVPDSVLNKPARLDDDEYAIMKSHVTKGAEILKGFTLVEHVIDGALYHHERYDGKGYIQGLSGEDIPVYGRIIGVADAFDAMTANRVYRKQLDFDYVLSELQKGKGTQFDPVFVEILIKLIETNKIDVKALYSSKKEGL